MLCGFCYGKRLIIRDGKMEPCPECGGQGLVHCCEGMQTQPDPELHQQPEVADNQNGRQS